MRSPIAQYLNEIVSLTIMALMLLAFVAGQAGASPQPDSTDLIERATIESPEPRQANFDIEDRLWVIDRPKLRVDITFRFRHTGE